MPHILFLMSDTGGGHRAASRAIEAALQERYPNQYSVELVDVWKDYFPYPFNTLPKNYGRWVNTNPFTYSAQFWLNDRLVRNRTISGLFTRILLSRMARLFTEHPADIVVCVHSVFVRPAAYAHRKVCGDKPFITVITDYALPTVLWYDPAVDRCLVPTEPAYARGLALGLRPTQLALTGAPVHPKFSHLDLTTQAARQQLGWDLAKPTVLLVGGGDGMGPLVATARAIDACELDCELVIVTGRNQRLKAALEAVTWKHLPRIYGFVEDMHVFMKAADLLITKAGPATITEAAILGLPVVLSGAIKFQESPNVEYVVANSAGVYAPGPERVATSVAEIFANGGELLRQLTAGAQRLAQPDAIWKIADEIHAYGGTH
ncbi:MAG: glycosyltransferase [Chloroflexota bacterium]